MNVLTEKTDQFEIEELACKILGLDYDEIDDGDFLIDDKLQDEFFIDLENFERIVSRLLPLVHVGISPLTNQKYKGFADVKKQQWIVKSEVA